MSDNNFEIINDAPLVRILEDQVDHWRKEHDAVLNNLFVCLAIAMLHCPKPSEDWDTLMKVTEREMLKK